MPTDDERREVAARLRDYVDLDFGDANPYWYVMKSAYGDVSIHGDSELFGRLADLIEPEPERTCRNLGGEEGTNYEYYDFACSSCGYCADVTEPNYCPYCRAKVVDE